MHDETRGDDGSDRAGARRDAGRGGEAGQGRRADARVELTLVDGGKVRLADLRGEVIVLNFWATWCGPCKQELPLLDAYHRRAAKHGLRVFAITTEDSVPLYRLKPVFATLAIASVRRVKGIPVDVAAVPTNYIIDRAGVVRHAASGALDLDDMNRLLVPLLREGYEPPASSPRP